VPARPPLDLPAVLLLPPLEVPDEPEAAPSPRLKLRSGELQPLAIENPRLAIKPIEITRSI
jgi:hypothetical protein